MTNLERAAAIAAERGWPLVETYRGWYVVQRDAWEFGASCPHEMDWAQFWQVFTATCGVAHYVTPAERDNQAPGLGASTLSDIRLYIDRWEAAREAMPATAFFGVEEVAL